MKFERYLSMGSDESNEEGARSSIRQCHVQIYPRPKERIVLTGISKAIPMRAIFLLRPKARNYSDLFTGERL